MVGGWDYFYDKAVPALNEVLKLPISESLPILLKAVFIAIIILILGLIIWCFSECLDKLIAIKHNLSKAQLDSIYLWIMLCPMLLFVIILFCIITFQS